MNRDIVERKPKCDVYVEVYYGLKDKPEHALRFVDKVHGKQVDAKVCTSSEFYLVHKICLHIPLYILWLYTLQRCILALL